MLLVATPRQTALQTYFQESLFSFTDTTPGDSATDTTPGDSATDTTPGDSATDTTPVTLLLTLLLVTLLTMRSDGITSIVAHIESALHADNSSSFCVLK